MTRARGGGSTTGGTQRNGRLILAILVVAAVIGAAPVLGGPGVAVIGLFVVASTGLVLALRRFERGRGA